VVDAPEMAVGRRRPGEELLAHSGRGSQHASEHYRRVPAGEGAVCSLSRKGDCWDDAPLESFFAGLKREPARREQYATREQARASIFAYIPQAAGTELFGHPRVRVA
jgi:transposase InsO family protein